MTVTRTPSKHMPGSWIYAKKGIIALKPTSRSRIDKFRAAIRDWQPDCDDDEHDDVVQRDLEFETYLLDALISKYSLTILLKRNNRKIKIENLPSLIFDRNTKLRGTLKPLKCKKYSDEDKNRDGTSRRQWRLVHLEGDAAFLDSISALPDDHIFKLGASGIQIRGGTRAESKKRRGENPHAANARVNSAAITNLLENVSDEVIGNEEEREKREFQGSSPKIAGSSKKNTEGE